MIDPDELAERRRKATPAPTTEPPAVPSLAQVETAERLARLREGDAMAEATRWLARVRGDMRPRTVGELERAIGTVAAEESLTFTVVREGLNRVLKPDGGLAAWEAKLRRAVPKLGRGGAATVPAITSQTAHRQLQLLPRDETSA